MCIVASFIIIDTIISFDMKIGKEIHSSLSSSEIAGLRVWNSRMTLYTSNTIPRNNQQLYASGVALTLLAGNQQLEASGVTHTLLAGCSHRNT